MQIAEMVVVEGEHDRDRVQKAVAADVIVTGGSHIREDVYIQLERAAKTRGLIIFTDPDYAGTQIRNKISDRFPGSKHAHLPQRLATKNGDIGIENAPLEEIRKALIRVRKQQLEQNQEFSMQDMLDYELMGSEDAARRREQLGAALHIGYANARSFLKRLNALRVTREEFLQAVEFLKAEDKR